jgi:hypothetical protein
MSVYVQYIYIYVYMYSDLEEPLAEFLEIDKFGIISMYVCTYKSTCIYVYIAYLYRSLGICTFLHVYVYACMYMNF